jgi:hypothetical protein
MARPDLFFGRTAVGMLLIALCGLGTANSALAGESITPPIQVHLTETGIFAGYTSFSVDTGAFSAELLYDGRRQALVYRTVDSKSGAPVMLRAEERMPMLERLLRAFFAQNPPQPTYEFSIGYYPELFVRLAKMSAQSPDWNKAGYLEDPAHVDALANWINEYDAARELRSALVGVGYRVVAVTTEKPVVQRWDACTLTRNLADSGANERGKKILCSVSVHFNLIRE